MRGVLAEGDSYNRMDRGCDMGNINSRVALYDVGDLVQVIPKDKMEHLPIDEQWVGILPEMLDMGGQKFEVQVVEYEPKHDTYIYALGSVSMWFWFSDNLLILPKVLNSADDESLDNLIM